MTNEKIASDTSTTNDIADIVEPIENDFSSYLECIDDIEEEKVDYLWKPYIPMGQFVLLAGDPGVGKTYITTFLASVVSNGGKFPFCEDSIEPGNVIIINGEDSIGGEIKRRLKQAGANLKNIFVISRELYNLKLSDTKIIKNCIEEKKPSLIIVDPINSFIGNVDTYKDSAFRSAMTPIVNLCNKYNTTLLCVTHLNKSGSDKAYYRVNGSVAYIGMPRAVLYLVNSYVNEHDKVLSQQKNSYGEKGKALSFNITDNGIKWLEQLDSFNIEEFTSSETFSLLQEAKNFILETLEKEEIEAKEFTRMARKNDIKNRTFERARSELRRNKTIDYRIKKGLTYWYLKPKKEETPIDDEIIQEFLEKDNTIYEKTDDELKITAEIPGVRDLASFPNYVEKR